MGDFTREDVAHLLRRSGFASLPDEVDALMGEASWADVVDRVLDPTASPPETIPDVLVPVDVTSLEGVVEASRYWYDRMVSTPTPIVERIAFFWHGILTSGGPGQSVSMIFRQIQTWRRLGLGDLHDLMQAMAIDPAMLDWLDNASNVKAAPNENFARELMELFTMGNGTFTEADVVAMARAWTGHNLRYADRTYVFRNSQHDGGDKTLFGITRTWDGPEAITEIVRGSKQAVCARYLAGRIWSAFVYPNPAPTLLDELADALIGAGMVVGAFLREVFLRPEFRLASTRTALVRSPVEWEVALMRATGLGPDDLRLDRYQLRLGQVLYRPPNVSGWRQNRAWISSSATWAKGLVATQAQAELLAKGTFADVAPMATADAVDSVLARFGVDDPSPATRQHLIDFLAAERSAGRGTPAAVATLPALVALTPDFQLA